jgi:hypothetical protein
VYNTKFRDEFGGSEEAKKGDRFSAPSNKILNEKLKARSDCARRRAAPLS